MSFNKMINGLATPEQKKKSGAFDEFVVNSGDKNNEPEFNKMDDIVAKAQASIHKVINSPFAPKHNDSLDAMRLEFMHDYNKIMKDSDENFFN